jgi:hypothetical protein
MILFLILPAYLLGEEKEKLPDSVAVILDYKSPKEYLPFSIPPTEASEGGYIKFEAPRVHGLTFIIPKADTLFADDLESVGFIIGRTKFLILYLNASELKWLRIADDANQGVGISGKRYPFVVYYRGEWAEGHSSPVIIIKPGS